MVGKFVFHRTVGYGVESPIFIAEELFSANSAFEEIECRIERAQAQNTQKCKLSLCVTQRSCGEKNSAPTLQMPNAFTDSV